MATNWLNRWRSGGVAALLLGPLLLALLTTENPLPARDEAKATALPSDLAKIPSDGLFVVSGRVADLWDSALAEPVCEKLTKEIGESAREFEKHFGLRIEQIERFTYVLLDPPPSRQEPLLFLHTTKPYDKDKVLAGRKAKEEKYKGQTLYLADQNWAVYILDDRSLVYGAPDGLRGLIDRPTPKSSGPLADAIRLAAGKHSLVYAVNVKAYHDALGDKLLPGEAEPFKPLLEATSGTLTVDLAKQASAVMRLTFPTEKDAKAALKPAQVGLDLGRLTLDQGIRQLSKQKEMPQIVEMLKQAQNALKATAIQRQGATLQASASLKIDVATVGTTVLEVVQNVRVRAAKIESASNLHNIGIAMHTYHDTNGRFPTQAAYDKNGKPMLSWRVLILPYIEQQKLYNEFHLNEPWASEHNKKLLAKMPKTYACPSDEKTLKDHTTYYQGFVGKGAFFEGKKGLTFADFTDGTSNTIMIVEASKAVPWSKPEDLPYDAAKLPKLGMPGANNFQAAFCDGSLHSIANTIKPATLRNLITRNDGNVINFNDF